MPAMTPAMRRVTFLHDHHHLISPWLFSELEIIERNAALLRRRWREYDERKEVAPT